MIKFVAAKEESDDKNLSHRQKQRLVKRVQKQKETKIKMSGHQRVQNQKQLQQRQKKYHSESEDEENGNSSVDGDGNDQVIKGFTDDNNKWLKLKQDKRVVDPTNGTEDGEEEESEEEEGSELESEDEDEEKADSDDELGEEEVGIFPIFSQLER